MIAFIDTEFTDFLAPELLSVGLVTLDGRELYCELDLESVDGKDQIHRASEFVKFEGVLSQWGRIPNAACTAFDMGLRVGEWLIGLAAESQNPDEIIDIAFDYGMDYELLEYSIRDTGLWEQVRELVSPVNVNPITGTVAGELAADECFRELRCRGLHRHHALADALALRAAYMAVKDAALAHHARMKSPESKGSQ